MLSGKYTDMGDVVIHEEWLVKGQHYGLVFGVGAPLDVLAWERTPGTRRPPTTSLGRIDLLMDLQADKKVTLSASFTDELGHPVPTPSGTTIQWSTDTDEFVTGTTNDDGTFTVVSTGEIGDDTTPANTVVSLSVEFPNGRMVTGDLLITSVAGDAERVVITPGEVTEVTPDDDGTTTPPDGGTTPPDGGAPDQGLPPVDGSGDGGTTPPVDGGDAGAGDGSTPTP